MAEPEKKEEAHAEGAEAAPAAPAAGGGGNKTLFIALAAIMVVMPLTGFGIAYFILKPHLTAGKKSEVHGEEHDKKAEEAGHGEEAKKDGHGEKKEAKKDGHGEKKEAKKDGHGEKKGEEEALHASINEMVVNVSGTRGTRFLRASMEFEAPANVLKEMGSHDAQIKDIVSSILSSKRLDELEAPDIRQKLRNEMITLINTVLKEGQISNIFFTDLVIQ